MRQNLYSFFTPSAFHWTRTGVDKGFSECARPLSQMRWPKWATLRARFKLRYLFFFSVLTWAARAPEAFTGDMELNTAAQMGVVFQALLINLAWATGKNPWDAVKKFGRGR
jgi:hypothetical protein